MWAYVDFARSGGVPPGILRRKAGTDHRTVVVDHGGREYPKASAGCRGKVPREARKNQATCHLTPPTTLIAPRMEGMDTEGLPWRV
jgi:hypothetical protein